MAIEEHLQNRHQQYGADPYLDVLHHRVKEALPLSSELAASVRQAHTCIRQLEHYLAEVELPFLATHSEQVQEQSLRPNIESQLEVDNTAIMPQSEVDLAIKSDDQSLTPAALAQERDVEPHHQDDATLGAQSEALAIPSASETVGLTLAKIIEEWQESALVNSTLEKVCRKWGTMEGKWLPGILHCYDIPGLPRSNLKLEARFGNLRQDQRRVSGRKETTPLRRLAPGQLLCQTLDEEEVLRHLQSVSTEDYWRERSKQEALEEPQRWLRRLHRDPLKALTQIDAQFSIFLKSKTVQRQALESNS